MKKFTTSSQVASYLNQLVKKSSELTSETITEQFYKDSREYTYFDSGDMYKSGATSNFKAGLITEHTPYVRRRYYEGGQPGKNSPAHAQAHWFEVCFKINKKTYEKMFTKIFSQAKRSV